MKQTLSFPNCLAHDVHHSHRNPEASLFPLAEAWMLLSTCLCSSVLFFLFLTRPGIMIYHFDISWALPRRVTQLSASVPLSPGNRQPQLGLHCLQEPPRGSHLPALFSLRLSGSPLPHHGSRQLSLLPHRGNSSPWGRRLAVPLPRTLAPRSLSRP